MDARSPEIEARNVEVETTPARPAKAERNRSKTKRSGRAHPVQKHTVPQRPLTSAFYRIDANTFAGHVVDRADLTLRYVVQLFIDGTAAGIAVAHEYDHALAEQGVGDGCYGFVFTVPGDALSDGASVEARVANAGSPIGAPISLQRRHESSQHPFTPCGVRWIGGLRFSGWMSEAANGAGKATAVIDGLAVAEAFPRSWRHIGTSASDARAAPAFDLNLPARFADGRVHTVRILDESGSDLAGSPLTFVAFEDGLEHAIARFGRLDSERLRGRMFDRLIPSSMPLSDFQNWSERFLAKPAASNSSEAVAVIFCGLGNDESSLRSLDSQTHANWVAATLPPVNAQGDFDVSEFRNFLEGDAAESDIFVFAICGTRLEQHALQQFAAAYRDRPEAAAIYADFAVLGDDTQPWPMLLPAFDYERLLEQGYCCYLFATRRRTVEAALAAGASNLYRLFNFIVGDSTGPGVILHLPEPLGVLPEIGQNAADALAAATAEHLQQRGIEADVTPLRDATFPAVRVARSIDDARMTIIIPTRNRADLLKRCLETIRPAASNARAEVLIVDNDSSDSETLAFLSSIEHRVAKIVRVPGAFNFAKLNNVAARLATGDHLCFLNNDIEATDDQWLAEMRSRIVSPDVGAVGATLLWPSRVIQHAGVVLGSNFGATHAFTDRMLDDPGYAGMLTVAHECSAVTAACLLTRKSDYLAVGGMDEIFFPVNFNDVDYCLKLRAMGKRIVITPHARLLHWESASRGADERPDRAGRMQRELRTLRARWLNALVNDPYYNPNLSLDSIPFSALAWPPRDRSARTNASPQPIKVPSGM